METNLCTSAPTNLNHGPELLGAKIMDHLGAKIVLEPTSICTAPSSLSPISGAKFENNFAYRPVAELGPTF